MKDFPETEAREAAENKSLNESNSTQEQTFVLGARWAWEKAQADIQHYQLAARVAELHFRNEATKLKIATEALEAVDTCAMHPGSEEDVVLLMLQTVREALAKIRGEHE